MLLLYLSCALLISWVGGLNSTAMDDYVWKKDPNFSWVDTGEVIRGRNRDGSLHYVGYILNMTSQRWLSDADTTRSLWWHSVVVVVPSNYDNTTSRNATLWITDGKNDNDEPPSRTNYNMIIASELAMGTGLITAALFQIPNEPMVFAADPEQKKRSEDAIIAYTWAHFLDHPDEPEWLVRLPMVKASLRAMDTVTAFVAQKKGLGIANLDYFTVTGASKRGWTAWDVGAVDQTGRVAAIVPLVLDAINFVEVEHHQYRSYGGWTFFLEDYYEQNITARFDDPNMVLLQQIEDPFFYKERLTMPKLVINAGQDEFQQPDDTHYWWNDMPGPKHFLMMPNTEHMCVLGFGQALPAIGTWIRHLVKAIDVPEISWSISSTTGDITATVSGLNTEKGGSMEPTATMWYAITCGKEDPARRDFRVLNLDNPCDCGIASDDQCVNREAARWTAVPLSRGDDGSYVAHMDADESGRWTAFFIDFTFPTAEGDNIYNYSLPTVGIDENDRAALHTTLTSFEQPSRVSNWPYDYPGQLDFTTEVSIWPNTFPFDDCSGTDCYGVLL